MSLLAAALLSCVPALPFYCGNIHVGCVGRTRIETSAFVTREGSVSFKDGTVWPVRAQADDGATILWRRDSRDWIRVEADGRFSLRRYRKGQAMMTRGSCVQVPAATR